MNGKIKILSFFQFRSSRLANLRSRLWAVLLFDILVVILAHAVAYWFRFDGRISSDLFNQICRSIPWLLAIKLPVFFYYGLYRGMWRYTSIVDLFSVLKATLISSSIIIAFIVYTNRFVGFSRSVFIMDAIFTFCLIAGNRILIRCVYQYVAGTLEFFPKSVSSGKKRILLIGAGDAAEKVIREIKENTSLPYVVVGLVDDNPRKHGRKIHGLSIFGSLDDIERVAEAIDVDELLITISSATSLEMKGIIKSCQASKVSYKILPGMGELIHGKISVSSVRKVSYRDLLGRPSVQLEQDEIGKYLTGKVVLVTGAGGSIGSELCRQIVRFKPERILLLDAGEENLYNIEMELNYEHEFTRNVAVLGKIQNRELLNKVLLRYKPTVVFHAAAYKHVPLVENNPWEAVFNNVFAVRNLIEVAIFHKVERFVLVSTDKAVRPTNVMGASKRLTELLMLAYCQRNLSADLDRECRLDWQESNSDSGQESIIDCAHNTKFMAVRFGNVLGSSGSVVPLFKHQIELGGPVTVTDPEITRYFMSIDEAAQLILQAGAMGEGGEIFLLHMGDPVKIDTLVRDLIKLMGLAETDIKIKYTGLRPGEKLYEELITEGEGIVPTRHNKIMVLKGDGKPYDEIADDLSLLASNAKNHNAHGVKMVLKKMIPEYVPDMKAKSIIEQ